ncbi:MAG: hypothetical protein ABIQ32_11925 [Sphingomicrobium sp.]
MALGILVALATASASPAEAPRAAAPAAKPAVAAKGKASAEKPDPMQTMAAMVKLFDKFFPAGLDPEPARLAAARTAAQAMFPKGAYAEAMSGLVNRTADRVLDMSEADFASMVPPSKDKKAKPAKAPSTEPLRLMLAKKDPMVDAKIAAVRAFASTMFVKLGDVVEPKFREGMARALARKFDARQLGEIQAFLATPTGAAYGREMVGIWFEPDVMRGSFEVFPELIKMMPAMSSDAMALGAQLKSEAKATAEKKKAD